MDPFLLLGVIGMVLILVAFLLNQSGAWKQTELRYDLVNLTGSVLLIVYAYDGRAWPFLVLNVVWALYSLRDVFRDLR